MADGQAAAFANPALTAGLAAGTWIQLHVGLPGPAGTANVAGNSVRKQATWGTPSGGSASNTAAITWPAVSTSETYTHYTAWSASSGGTFTHSGAVTASGVTAGNDFTVNIGGLVATYTLAS